MKVVDVYTDGSCNKRVGGWGVFIKYGDLTRSFSGSSKDTTNNLMELKAVVMALKALRLDKPGFEFRVHLDSRYVMLTILNRAKYEAKEFKKVANADAIRWFYSFLDTIGIGSSETTELASGSTVSFIKVDGHSGNVGNDIADRLAVTARKSAE